ncbi:hypothetical protein [Clostridium butyricum]|uniref:hypothetical protein n=1 Tax=Clostridium butyricum TaxID=1492 RepID=UPI00374E278E
MKIEKISAREVANDNELIKAVKYGNIRKCSYCGFYVNVDDFAGEHEYRVKDGITKCVYDICDECCEGLHNNIIPKVEEENYYEDYED